MGSNDVQGHEGIDNKPQMQPHVKYTMIKDRREIGAVCSCDRQHSTNQQGEEIFMNHSISLENKKVNQFNSDLFMKRLLCEQRSAPCSRGD